MTTVIFHHWDGSSNSTLCRFAAKGISKNIIIRPLLGPKINIEKSQMGPHKGPMMEFGKNYDGSGVPIGRSFSSMSFIQIDWLLFFTPYISIGPKFETSGAPLGPKYENGHEWLPPFFIIGGDLLIPHSGDPKSGKPYPYSTCKYPEIEI